MNSADFDELPGDARPCTPTARPCMTYDARFTGSAKASATGFLETHDRATKCTPVHYHNLKYTVISRPCTTVRPKCTTVHI
ncbi:hypothetical protein Hanom_Chr03g00206401 [Helianthus anomalus]